MKGYRFYQRVSIRSEFVAMVLDPQSFEDVVTGQLGGWRSAVPRIVQAGPLDAIMDGCSYYHICMFGDRIDGSPVLVRNYRTDFFRPAYRRIAEADVWGTTEGKLLAQSLPDRDVAKFLAILRPGSDDSTPEYLIKDIRLDHRTAAFSCHRYAVHPGLFQLFRQRAQWEKAALEDNPVYWSCLPDEVYRRQLQAKIYTAEELAIRDYLWWYYRGHAFDGRLDPFAHLKWADWARNVPSGPEPGPTFQDSPPPKRTRSLELEEVNGPNGCG